MNNIADGFSHRYGTSNILNFRAVSNDNILVITKEKVGTRFIDSIFGNSVHVQYNFIGNEFEVSTIFDNNHDTIPVIEKDINQLLNGTNDKQVVFLVKEPISRYITAHAQEILSATFYDEHSSPMIYRNMENVFNKSNFNEVFYRCFELTTFRNSEVNPELIDDDTNSFFKSLVQFWIHTYGHTKYNHCELYLQKLLMFINLIPVNNNVDILDLSNKGTKLTDYIRKYIKLDDNELSQIPRNSNKLITDIYESVVLQSNPLGNKLTEHLYEEMFSYSMIRKHVKYLHDYNG